MFYDTDTNNNTIKAHLENVIQRARSFHESKFEMINKNERTKIKKRHPTNQATFGKFFFFLVAKLMDLFHFPKRKFVRAHSKIKLEAFFFECYRTNCFLFSFSNNNETKRRNTKKKEWTQKSKEISAPNLCINRIIRYMSIIFIFRRGNCNWPVNAGHYFVYYSVDSVQLLTA